MTDADDRAQQQPDSEPEVEQLLEFMRDSRGFDFTGYKRNSLVRRIRKRMADVGAETYEEYRDRLETDGDEFRNLFNTVLINVTGFLRDSEAWEYLERDVMPEILSETEPGEEIRIWSAGRSSGEEAYSLAIVFAEVLGIPEFIERVKIYGTDVDEDALREARAGIYPAKALEVLDPKLRDRYFDHNGAGFIFRPDLRRRVIFGRHDITRDAPISRLNLLVCRNTLMYFTIEAQQQILDRFFFALRPGGFLFLGKAEMLLSDGERFDVQNMRHRVFRRRAGDSPAMYPPPIRLDAGVGIEVRDASRRRQLRDLVFDSAPNATIVVDTDGCVILANRQARTILGLARQDIGRPFRDLEISYRPIELRSHIERCYRDVRSERISGVERRSSGDDVEYFDISIQPLLGTDGLATGVALTFTDTTLTTQLQHEVKRNREDLETAYEELQSTNEELETTNEELQSSIEELETTNEELQSTNEELETTNEELQSGNEELETMNEEMQIRTSELDETRTFLQGVLGSIAAGVVVVDANFKIRSWNRGAEEMWGLRADEVVNKPFFQLEFGLPTGELHAVARQSLDTGRPQAPVRLLAINRKGHTINCAVTCSPLESRGRGVVLLMESTVVDA